MRTTTACGVLCAALLAASPAFAVTITNQDSKPHTIVINHDQGETRQQIAAGQSATVNCPDNCGFRDLAFGTSRTVGGNAKLVIDKDGELHVAGGKGDFEMPNGTN